MAIKIKDLSKKINNALTKSVKILESRRFLDQTGDYTVKMLRRRIQLGYGVSRNGGKRRKFDKLSDSYVAQRQNRLGFWTRSDGVVVPIYTATNKELRAFRASKSARKQSAKNRKYLKENNPKLSSKTSPKKSNLTRTGEMIEDSLGHIVLNRKIIIGMSDEKNAKKAAYVSKRRPFLYLTGTEIRKVTTMFRKRAQAIFRQALK